MTDRELMQQALDVLEDIFGKNKIDVGVINRLRERLAQPEQEPVAWVYLEGLEALKSGRPWTAYGSNEYSRIPLYLKDAVAPRVEPRASGSGAGFESPPASPTTEQGQDMHEDWCASLTQLLMSMPPKPAPCNCKLKTARRDSRQWQGLTDEDVKSIWRDIDGSDGLLMRFVRVIEARLKEKNHG